jgi:hypothetical protein
MSQRHVLLVVLAALLGVLAAAPTAAAAPLDVVDVVVKEGEGIVSLSWTLPEDPTFERVVVVRSLGGTDVPVYSGTDVSFTDRGLKSGITYRYTIFTYDGAGGRSTGIALSATPRGNLLDSPADGARFSFAPILLWNPAKGATYYNLQLFKNGKKILSVWPKAPRYALQERWTSGGQRFTLRRGNYTWYVWPGFGPRAKSQYGELLGSRSFTIIG